MAVLRDGLIGWPFRLANVTVAPLKQTLPISSGSRGGWRSSWYWSALFLVLPHLNKNWDQLNVVPCLGAHGFQSNSPNCTWPGLGVKMAINSFGDAPTIYTFVGILSHISIFLILKYKWIVRKNGYINLVIWVRKIHFLNFRPPRAHSLRSHIFLRSLLFVVSVVLLFSPPLFS